MKQLLQSMKTGKTIVQDVPIPSIKPGFTLVQNAASLVSAGTERMLVEFGEKNLLQKVRSRPDLARQVIDKARREGIFTALDAAFNRLDQPMTLGYSCAGTIVEVGEGLKGFKPGDRVACAGGGFAVHAEYALVPQNLMAHIPDNVDFDSAAFSTLGAIAMHGFRLAKPQVGERVAIIGLGLLGLLASGIARAAGCVVTGVDLDPERVKLAESLGYPSIQRSDAESFFTEKSDGNGWDIVLICADTPSSDPVELAGKIARDRGRVIAIGAFGLNMPRKPYYDKELTFKVSRSYGPGRYDPSYEEQGHDYPAGYVRWTEGRNLQAILDLQGSGLLDVHPLITHRISIEDAARAYDLIIGKLSEPFLGVLLTYPQTQPEIALHRTVIIANQSLKNHNQLPGLGILGAGLYANSTFLPSVSAVGGVNRVGIASGTGLNARYAGGKFGFQYSTSEEEKIFQDENVNLIAILTRHNQHSRQVIRSLQLKKHVFCEKPLAIDTAGVDAVFDQLQQPEQPVLMVGFNRRFAPLAVEMKRFLDKSDQPRMMHYTVNAGILPLNHWLHDPKVGGGRIIGEGCHFIDFMTWLANSLPVSVSTISLPDGQLYREDNLNITIKFANGSIGVLSYLANGDKSHPKERCEVFCGGRVAVLDDFRKVDMAFNGKKTSQRSSFRQDKGHQASWKAFLDGVKSGVLPIPYEQIRAVCLTAIAAVESLHTGKEIIIS
jgi:predicted dehydrogenase/threonine dehydrogenase-like Zn-dependent dehydrogenase